jgi:hypothetical protein
MVRATRSALAWPDTACLARLIEAVNFQGSNGSKTSCGAYKFPTGTGPERYVAKHILQFLEQFYLSIVSLLVFTIQLLH